MAEREGHEVVVVFEAGIGGGALYGDAADGVGAVQDHYLDVGFGAGFEEVAGEGFEGPEAGAGVLEVDDDGVELLEVGVSLGALVGGLGAVELDDGDVGGGVGFGADVFRVNFCGEAVLGGEEGFELEFGGMRARGCRWFVCPASRGRPGW